MSTTSQVACLTTRQIFISCVGSPTPRGSTWLTKSCLKLCLHWQHLISYSITYNTWASVPLISHMLIISNHQGMSSYCEHFQVPKPFYDCWTNAETVPTCKQLCIARIIISNFKIGFEMQNLKPIKVKTTLSLSDCAWGHVKCVNNSF